MIGDFLTSIGLDMSAGEWIGIGVVVVVFGALGWSVDRVKRDRQDGGRR